MGAERYLYGIHAVQSLLHSNPGSITRILVHKDRFNARVRDLLQQAEKLQVPVEQVERDRLEKLAPGTHQGVVAMAHARTDYVEADLYRLLDYIDELPLLLVLDGVTDPHNLGACLRSADAAGVHAVIVPKDNSSSVTSVVSKVSCGAAETVPVVRVTNLARTLRNLQQRGLWVTGLDGEAKNSIYEVDLSGGRVLVLGSEGHGMRRLTREHCDELAAIPMRGYVSSLNVSVASGICLFEAVRQRNLAARPSPVIKI